MKKITLVVAALWSWLVLACQTTAPMAETSRPSSLPAAAAAAVPPAVIEVAVEHRQLPVFVSGLWVEDDGAVGGVVGDGGEGSPYLLQRWPQPGATAQLTAAPAFTISVDDALLVGHTLWLAGSLSAHDPGTELLRIDAWTADSAAAPAAVAVQRIPAPDLPPMHNWRLLDAPAAAGWFAATAAPLDPDQRRQLGTALLLDDRAAQQQQLVLLHEASACHGGSLQHGSDHGWQAQLACSAQDGTPLLVVVEQPAGRPLTVRAIHLAQDPALAGSIERCLGGPADQLVDLRRRADQLALAVCRQVSGQPACALVRLTADLRSSDCAALPAGADRSIDRVAWCADGALLAASRAGALWRLPASAERFEALRSATIVGDIAPPRPAFSPGGRFALFGRHALEPGQRAALVRVDVTPDR